MRKYLAYPASYSASHLFKASYPVASLNIGGSKQKSFVAPMQVPLHRHVPSLILRLIGNHATCILS